MRFFDVEANVPFKVPRDGDLVFRVVFCPEDGTEIEKVHWHVGDHLVCTQENVFGTSVPLNLVTCGGSKQYIGYPALLITKEALTVTVSKQCTIGFDYERLPVERREAIVAEPPHALDTPRFMHPIVDGRVKPL